MVSNKDMVKTAMMTSPKDPTTDPAASDVPSLSEAFSNQIEV